MLYMPCSHFPAMPACFEATHPMCWGKSSKCHFSPLVMTPMPILCLSGGFMHSKERHLQEASPPGSDRPTASMCKCLESATSYA